MLILTLTALLLVAQLAALVVLLMRLAQGRNRLAPVEPLLHELHDTTVSVVLPARNEAARIGPCLAGLQLQGAPLAEVIVVDGGSTDGTGDLVDAAGAQDRRIRRITEPPRPVGTVGRPWAIAAGCRAACGEWILVLDADVTPRAGMVAGVTAAARALGLDAVSFAPSIRAPGSGARWLQPAFLTTLVYRFGAAGVRDAEPHRVLANGQCLLVRRDELERVGGYEVAADSYCDDIRIARHLAANGASVAFLDGPRLLEVEMYPTGQETWRAWPRSLNARDATPVHWRWVDAGFLFLVQALPLALLLTIALAGWPRTVPGWLVGALAAVNGVLLAVRLLVSFATAGSFSRRGAAYWLSPLADLPAVLRVIQTMLQRPREWRGGSREVSGARHG